LQGTFRSTKKDEFHMTTVHSLGRGIAASTAILGLVTMGLAGTLGSAQAAPLPAAYSAQSSAEALHVNALNLSSAGGPDVADLVVAQSADAKNLAGSALVGQNLPLLSTAHAAASNTAKSPAPVSNTTVPAAVPGLVSLGVSTSTAAAKWAGDRSCLPTGGFYSKSTSEVAGVQLAPGSTPVLSVPGTISAWENTGLVRTGKPNGNSAVRSSAGGSTAKVLLLGGQLTVNVESAPKLVATASGVSGGAKVSWTPAKVSVVTPGGTIDVPLNGTPVSVASPANPALTVELSISAPVQHVASTGRHADATAATLHIKAALGPAVIADVNLLPLKVSATAPTGGIDCLVRTATDSDGDGLSNARERQLGTNPSNPDTDGDGLTDGQEANVYGTNPKQADTDGDGLKDGAEVTRYDTNPKKADTDGDGIKDGAEVRGFTVKGSVQAGCPHAGPIGTVRTNPLKADTDRDGLEDGVEARGYRNAKYGMTFVSNPVRANSDSDGLSDKVEVTGSANGKFGYKPSNPLKCDTDGAGVWDGDEVRAGSDPTNPNSTPSNP
jgi:hypothetical protein